MSFSPVLTFYRGASAALTPFAGLWLDARARNGKEDPARLSERYGHAPRPRPAGRLAWLHGASVGESGVALQIADALAKRDPQLSFLLTTGTKTSAELVERRMPARAQHLYAPLDSAGAARRFIQHWRPDLGVFVESELWPNLILEAQAAGVPLALVNARMSPQSIGRWTRWPNAARRLLDAFAIVLAADERTADALSALRNQRAPALGNLKLAAEAPPVNEAARAALETAIGARLLWLGASTHAGEEDILIAAHKKLRAHWPDALLILAPRHPDRGAEIATRAGDAPRRALQQDVAGPIYVADTLGEMGLLYALTPVAFVAGSLMPHLKGHNPVEPAKLDAAIVTGPYVESFDDLFASLFAAGGATRASSADAIAEAIAALWREPEARTRSVAAARRVVEGGGAALEETVSRLAALLPARIETQTANATA